MLRAVQMGLSIADMDLLSMGLLMDMYTEAMNDGYYSDEDGEYMRNATQADFDNF